MHPRLDPACADAQSLDKAHARQRRLMLEGKSEGRLAAVVDETQARQLEAHVASCGRCASFDPRCPACGFDTRSQRHGWRCPNQASRWTDALPWNWRSRRASAVPSPPPPPPASASAPEVAAMYRVPPPARPASPPPARRHASGPEPQRVSPYMILGVAASATELEVRAAFRDKARQYHPDKVAHMAPEFRTLAERKMREINQAYDIIRKTWA